MNKEKIIQIFLFIGVIMIIIWCGKIAIDTMEEQIEEVQDFCKDKNEMQNYSKSIINCTAWNEGKINALAEHFIA